MDNIIHEFTILHEGWEMDNLGWVMDDGRIYTTNHGGECEMPRQALLHKIKETKDSLRGLEKALWIMNMKMETL